MVVKTGNWPRTLIGYNIDSESMKMKPQTQRSRSIPKTGRQPRFSARDFLWFSYLTLFSVSSRAESPYSRPQSRNSRVSTRIQNGTTSRRLGHVIDNWAMAISSARVLCIGILHQKIGLDFEQTWERDVCPWLAGNYSDTISISGSKRNFPK